MNLDQARVNWMVSDERTALLNALNQVMTQRLLMTFPDSPVFSMAAELATAALREVDALLAHPVQVAAAQAVVNDHR